MTDNTSKKLREQALFLQQVAKEMRQKEMRELKEKGWTLEEIGKKYGISKERVRQILAK